MMKKAHRPTVLLACADAKEGRSCARGLAVSGCRAVEYSDGQEALLYLQGHIPDLAILDANLPSLGGGELCLRMKRVKRLKDVPVIMLVFASDEEAMRRAERSGAERLVKKPVEIRVLVTLVRELLSLQDGNAEFRLQPSIEDTQ